MKAIWRKASLAVLYLAAAVLLDLASGYFVLQTGLAICYPPAGLYLAAVLILGWKALPLAFLNPFFSVLVTLNDPSIPFMVAVLIGVVSMISPTLILISLKQLAPSGEYLHNFRQVSIYAGMVLFSVAIESLAASLIYILFGLADANLFWINAVGWWISNVIPMLTLAPMLLLIQQPAIVMPNWWRGSYGMLALLTALFTPLAILITLAPRGYSTIPRLYIGLLPILIGALAGGIFGGTWSALWVAFSVLTLAPTYLVETHLVIEAQFFLLVSTLSGLATGSVVSDRRLTESELRASEQRYRRLSSELEERVQQRTADLEAKNRELETLAYAVAHDLKAPLRGIDGYSHLLLDTDHEQLDQESKLFIRNIRQAVNSMNQLIDDLLAYSRLEYRTVKQEQVDLPAIVDSLLAERQMEIEARGVSLQVDIQCRQVFGETQSLSQALRNLIDNALKFTQDVAQPAIEIGSRNSGQAVLIWVADNGIGFGMQYSDRIFEIFQRLHRAEDYPGTGIGLALVRKAMHHMGGRAWAESAPGHGATFYLEIPQTP
ncbi:MAG: MASE1 domain-containing protein [Anaerolineales bacterium]|nr:MASE1 domain-containing protein [Anaerolineales bacterium]